MKRASLQIHANNPLERASTGSVLWRLPLKPWLFLPERIKYNGHELTRKAEFHITVLGRDLTARYLLNADLTERWFQSWATLDHRLTVTDELWLLRKSEQDSTDHSFVTDCLAPALHEARRLLGLWVKEALPPAVAHITLYTEINPMGISLADDQALRERRVASGPWSTFGLSYPASE